ncbi:hypothetical protein [Kurthia gibsonii]|uniref:hypothetical protein n=1 Tax=Kurthia gibsonii TaxID=33946 RepID=UPI0031B73693
MINEFDSIIKEVKELSGVDINDDATMMQVLIDFLIIEQKNERAAELFMQLLEMSTK